MSDQSISTRLKDAELIAAYIEQMRWQRRSETTITIRRTYLAKLSRDLGPFGKIKPKKLQAWLADPERDLMASSQAVLIGCFHGFYTWAIKTKRLKKDPTLRIDKPSQPTGEPHPITDEDLERAFDQSDALMRCWLALGAYAGCRCQEMALLTREDVRDDGRMSLYIAHAKGNKTRHVPLSPKLLEALNGWGMPESGRLWAITPQEMSKAVGGYLHSFNAQRVDGQPASAHSLRHWFGSKTYQKSKDLRLTMTLMGHVSPATTTGYAAADTSQAAGIVGSL